MCMCGKKTKVFVLLRLKSFCIICYKQDDGFYKLLRRINIALIVSLYKEKTMGI